MPTPSHDFQQTWQRMLTALNVRNDSSLAKFLAISPAGVSSAKSKQKIPRGWFEKICRETGISYAWLTGEEPVEKPVSLHIETPPTPLPPMEPLRTSPPPPSTGKQEHVSQRKNNPEKFNVAEIISQAIEVLESDTVFSNALVTSIKAFHKALDAEKQISNFNSDMLEAFSAFQKQQVHK